ncbi:MAG: spermidine/putrescine ABC transporter substrate-binding protein [Oscillatoriales cyanobacterium]|uniref:Spermidine/putrescine ABC transporter substrate-binding protein n=1 Tax=Microcoleus anatoxicus PTRS2 TaxID=2705321 RepID=A0ABU8YL09_9CYAN|nr:MAG: spermidine/putrescine ABC transporter substrate-binding protein [Oscillatoriales cyanobacterium]TAD95987.1 MAG: spermidine/putrescine ABC transporter substrate-binding protein [Oscillatoriales cyanobacterium]TAE04463.1 MAG: spermidine/putrescine ABC transporter substrate-binding protein [Oscillatoriales cyanobacterium]TAF02655.1 MAG: spermidine/putrescine ABC transporter substrate-binding protein [Oscillatoriales cyanobacterium]TAF44841.1 MAG: spermidine/putrescine ABC transporter subst
MPPTNLPISQISRANSTRRQFLKNSAATISGLALSSCGWRLADVQSAPPIKGNADQLFIYTWAGYTDKALLDRFAEKTGIRVVADVFDSNEAMLARVQAGGGRAYSIIYPSDYMVVQMTELGLLSELDHSILGGLDRLKKQFQNPVYDPGNRYSVPLSWGTTGLIYNSEQLKEAPTDWDYLWKHKQELTRRMTLANDVREVMGAALRMQGFSLNSTNPEQVKKAYEKLVELKPAIASFTTDAWRPQMLTGDLKVAMCYSSDANEVISDNDKLRYVVPKSGSSLWTDTLVIPKGAPNPEAAYQWINFMLQADVAAALVERLSFSTPSEDAFSLLTPEVRDNKILFPSEATLKNCEGVAPVGKFIDVYDRYWTKLTSG